MEFVVFGGGFRSRNCFVPLKLSIWCLAVLPLKHAHVNLGFRLQNLGEGGLSGERDYSKLFKFLYPMTTEEKQTVSNLKRNNFMECLPFVSVSSAKYSHMSFLEKVL